MEPIFDPNGILVGWLKPIDSLTDDSSEDTRVTGSVYDLNGQYLAFVLRDTVFSADGIFLGYMDGGYFRDKLGDAVAFTLDAKGGPITPIPKMTPVAPVPAKSIAATFTPVPPIMPIGTLSWSDVTWLDFVA